jgi:hypothetical protein
MDPPAVPQPPKPTSDGPSGRAATGSGGAPPPCDRGMPALHLHHTAKDRPIARPRQTPSGKAPSRRKLDINPDRMRLSSAMRDGRKSIRGRAPPATLSPGAHSLYKRLRPISYGAARRG